MNSTQLAALIRSYTGTNSTTFTDADILALANPLKDDIAGEIVEVYEDYFDREFLANIVAGQRQYSLPDEVLNKIKYIEAKIDGTKQIRLDEFDINSYQRATDEATIVSEFGGKWPAVDIDGTSIFIYSDTPIINVTNGLIVKAMIFPADLTTLSGSIDMLVDPDEYTCGFPRQFHELWARRVAMAWKSNRPKPIPLSEIEKLYYVDLAKKIDALKGHNIDRIIEADCPYDNGQDY